MCVLRVSILCSCLSSAHCLLCTPFSILGFLSYGVQERGRRVLSLSLFSWSLNGFHGFLDTALSTPPHPVSSQPVELRSLGARAGGAALLPLLELCHGGRACCRLHLEPRHPWATPQPFSYFL